MKLLDRGFITVRHTNAYWAWANKQNDLDVEFSEEDGIEPNVYLIEEDFFEIEPIIEKNYKKIFEAELEMVTENEDLWPEKRNIDLFNEWFELELGSSVVDLLK